MEGVTSVEVVNSSSSVAKFDLSLNASVISQDQLVLEFEYAQDIFEEQMISRLAANMIHLARSSVDHPDEPIGHLKMLSVGEMQLLAEWNNTERDFGDGRAGEPVHYLLEYQASQTPNAPAIEFEGNVMTYRQLNECANQLAHLLQDKWHVGPDTLVPLFAERSLEMAVAIWGILKAGGGYVPIDHDSPPARVAVALQDIDPTLIVTTRYGLLSNLFSASPTIKNIIEDGVVKKKKPVKEEESSSALSTSTGDECTGLVVDLSKEMEREILSKFPNSNPPHICTGYNIAYAIFTSGSTGTPKAAINHTAALTNRLLCLHDIDDAGLVMLSDQDRVAQSSAFQWDGSALEVFCSAVGACVVFAPVGASKDVEALAHFLDTRKITVAFFVPVILTELVTVITRLQLKCGSLRRVVSAGEALSLQCMHSVFNSFAVYRTTTTSITTTTSVVPPSTTSKIVPPKLQLYNMYGPAEAGVDSTTYKCTFLTEWLMIDRHLPSVPIGKPIHNVQIYIVDKRLQQVPIGVVGELCVSGVSVGRGYLKRPELTRQKFVPDPFFSVVAGGISINKKTTRMMMYRTGDLGQHLPDGNILFTGRTDFQVKLHGVRLELGEIEAVLKEHHLVQHAVVIMREDRPGIKYLAGYVVLVATTTDRTQTYEKKALVESELRQHMGAKLPVYMVPVAIEFLETLPLLSSGKINRKALPVPSSIANPKEGCCPTTPEVSEMGEMNSDEENLLQKIWADILPAGSAIGLHTNFFHAGGDSVSALKLVARVNASNFCKVTLHDILEAQTISTLAKLLFQRTQHKTTVSPDGMDIRDETVVGNRVHSIVDWQSECTLPRQLLQQKIAQQQKTTPTIPSLYGSAVLLTGVTGFVGCHLLQSVLQMTAEKAVAEKLMQPQHIFCIVKHQALSSSSPATRLKTMLIKYRVDIPQLTLDERVHCISGDVAVPHLGVCDSDWSLLSSTVSCIVHNAAVTSAALSYDMLCGPNVNSTIQVIKLATCGVPKVVIYVSSLSALTDAELASPSSQVKECTLPADALFATLSPYGATKRVSELLLQEAAVSLGVKSFVLRLGLVSANSKTGAANPSDTINRFLLTMIQLRTVPNSIITTTSRSSPLSVPSPLPPVWTMVPVDWAADCMCNIALLALGSTGGCRSLTSTTTMCQVFHIIGAPVSLDTVVGAVEAFSGGTYRRVDYSEWCAQVSADPSCAMWPLRSLLYDGREFPFSREDTVVSTELTTKLLTETCFPLGANPPLSTQDTNTKSLRYLNNLNQ
eukprot:TRINITY_DN18535_c0_g1_i1.p1 TRINITY_DN18535_c0_g1~~TRINITY_DN18535_c0_g1_i1.p1  ORF type:complete len:1269 (+),score=311.26 TRINITY_DN18535_c0_g1_i1:2467-6273(+)